MRGNSFSVALCCRFGGDFEGTFNYTYSNVRDNVGGSRFGFPANNYDLTPEMGRADFDIRHKVNLAGVFDLPFRSLQLGAVLTLASGAPFDITTGFDDNGDTEATDRPAGVTRNTGQGPGFAQLDLRLSKPFTVGRALESGRPGRLELGLDAFNVLNHTNYDKVIGVQSSPFFGRPTSARAARSVQLSARFRF